jgi:hypothetical protein
MITINKINNLVEIKDLPVEEYLEFLKINNFDGISINDANGFSLNSIEPYCEIINVKRFFLAINHNQKINYECVEKMIWLEELGLTIGYDDSYYFNFSGLQNLKLLGIEWNSKLKGLDKLHYIRELSLYKFKGNTEIFSNYHLMADFALTQGNIKDLDFLKYFPKLKKLFLAYIPSLKNDDGLKYIYETVEEIDIDACPNLSIVNHLENFKNLKLLRLKTREPIPNLRWAQKLPKLEFLAIGDTNIVDGDFNPASDINYVSMQDKKHYNYKFDREKWKIVPK